MTLKIRLKWLVKKLKFVVRNKKSTRAQIFRHFLRKSEQKLYIMNTPVNFRIAHNFRLIFVKDVSIRKQVIMSFMSKKTRPPIGRMISVLNFVSTIVLPTKRSKILKTKTFKKFLLYNFSQKINFR